MADAENNQHYHQAKPRTRRSALADISNTIASSISNLLPSKKAAAKKRKIDEGEEPAEHAEPVLETEETEVARYSPLKKKSRQSKGSSVGSDDDHSELAMKRTGGAFVDSPCYGRKSPEEIEFERNGFFQPPKIKRQLPLPYKAADPSACHDILDDIYAFYFDTEKVFMAKPYFDYQPEITPRMRTILIDWIIEVHYKYKLNTATLWLTINIMDRYLEKMVIPRTKLQLVGITSLFLACKFEEIHSPQVADCVYLTDSAFKKEEILEMERSLLISLDYQFIVPTPHHFMIRYLNRLKAIERVRLMACFISERNIQEVEVLMYPPTVYAAACVYLALYAANYAIIQKDPDFKVWTDALVEESGGLKEADFMECARCLLFHVREPPVASTRRKLDAVKKKYANEQCQNIGEYQFPSLIEYDE